MKIGIFGGSFNPPHSGHLNAVSSVARKMGLDKVFVIPSNQNPLKPDEIATSATPQQRLEMSRLAFSTLGPQFEVSDLEIARGGKSYTIDTIKALQEQFPKDNLFLIIGVDNLASFDKWKSWDKILGSVNLIVTSRPGWEIPSGIEALPAPIQTLVENFEFNVARLKNGRSISFVTLKDINVSSSEIRRNLQIGKLVSSELTLEVENYIKSNHVYPRLKEKIEDYQKFVEECVGWMMDRKALNVRAFDLSGLESAVGHFAIVASGTSTKHVSSIADYLKLEIKKKYNLFPQAIEGLAEGKWVVLDYGVVLVHVFYEFVRQAYALEQLWSGAKEISITPVTHSN
jgi:nicotinate-nucleotide adenylyltransferase